MINTYCCDCMEFMRSKPDKWYDLAIVDPPYYKNAKTIITPGGNLSTTGVERRKYPMPHWNPPDSEYFRELFRVSKEQIIFGINYFAIPNPGWGRLVWDKVKDNGTDFSDCEIAYCSLLRHVRIFRYMWNGMCQGKSVSEGTVMQGDKRKNEKRIHPTQKPIALYKWILSEFAIPMREKATSQIKILDTHLGSGSIVIACDDFGLDLDGCEVDPFYFAEMEKRVARHQRQMKFNFEEKQYAD